MGVVDQIGNIAVLEGDGGLITGANPFDLLASEIAFEPLGRAYRVRRRPSAFEPSLGRRLSIGDDASIGVDLPFSFSLFGESWDRVFINSDGNLTFGRGDSASSARSVSRFLTGAPRIAPFFTDLDPSEGGSVSVAELPNRLVVTWDKVTEWGETNENTFQVVLERNGRVVVRYETVDARRGIVGLSPGGVSGGPRFVDLSAGSESEGGAVVERFLAERVIDNVATTKRFYQHFPDQYEAVVLWTTFESDTDNSFAFESTIQNDIRGIGSNQFDVASAWGSDGKLESFIYMGNIDRYPDSPTARVRGASGGPTILALLAHEVGHRWLAKPQFMKAGVRSNALLGRGNAHWSFFLDSDGSFLEGNEYTVQGGNQFRTAGFELRYSSLDLYLMGFIPASGVAPFFYIEGATGQDSRGEALTNEAQPETGLVVTGTRRNVLLDDVILAEGPRAPDFQKAPKQFRHAWVLLHRNGLPPSAAQIAKLESIRTAWEPFFQSKTRGRAIVSTTLVR